MKLHSVRLKNFRGYSNPQVFNFRDFTTIIGKNDSGKSTVLEALDLFFNDKKIESTDVSVQMTESELVEIECRFNDLPKEIIIDSTNPTTLQDEFLLDEDECLRICYKYKSNGASEGCYIKCSSFPLLNGKPLISLKIAELRKACTDAELPLVGDQTKSRTFRMALYESDLIEFEPYELEVSKAKEDAKALWEKLKLELPIYNLFKADRASTDQESEAQDPLQAVIKEVISRYEDDFEKLTSTVNDELRIITDKTIRKLKNLNPDVADQLVADVEVPSSLNFAKLFKAQIFDEHKIPMNKKGSGTRRLCLLSFFQVQAENKQSGKNVIYAIEEPETSQHPNNQKLLIRALVDLSAQGAQIAITTHNPTLARYVPDDSLIYISKEDGCPLVKHSCSDDKHENVIRDIIDSLGVIPTTDTKAVIFVEGVNDIRFLESISDILRSDTRYSDYPNIKDDDQFIKLAPGGGNLSYWAHKFKSVQLPEIHIYDSDKGGCTQKQESQLKAITNINEDDRKHPKTRGFLTRGREMENYLHIESIQAYLDDSYNGASITCPNFTDESDIPLELSKVTYESENGIGSWKVLSDDKKKEREKRIKRKLNTTAVSFMTLDLLEHSDPQRDVHSWFEAIKETLL